MVKNYFFYYSLEEINPLTSISLFSVTVAGWGTLSEGGSQPAELMKVDVNVWTNQRCKASYGKSAPGGITSHMLCAADTNRDSCSVSCTCLVFILDCNNHD